MADRETFSPILNNIKGIVMFGVPNLGMHQSHLQAMVEGQANETLVQDLSRENGSSYLRQLNKAFNGLSFLKTTCTYWAYETKETSTAVVSSREQKSFLLIPLLTQISCKKTVLGPGMALQQYWSILTRQPVITIPRTNYSRFPLIKIIPTW